MITVRGTSAQYLGLTAVVIVLIVLAYLGLHALQNKGEEVPSSVKRFFIGTNSIRVRVEGLEYCGIVPKEYTCDVERPSVPKVSWSSVNGAASYALIVIDPDAPLGPFYHLVVYGLERTSWPPGGVLGTNSAGELGWFPVCPPKGDKPHRYFFVVLALNKKLELPPGLSAGQLLERIKPYIIAYGFTCGKYARK